MNYKEIYKDSDKGGAYLFYGKEKYLIENAIGYLKNKYIKGTDAFNYIKIEGTEATPADIITAAETYPVMSDKKLVLVKDVSFFISENNLKKSFYEFLENLDNFVILIFWDRASIKKTTKFYKEMKKLGRDVEFPKLSLPDFRNFVNQYFLRKKKKIKTTDIAYFIEKSGYNSRNEDKTLLDIKTEMDKIISATSGEVITREDIDGSITENVDSNIFNFLDAMMKRNTEIAILELDNMYRLNEEIPKIFYMIIRQVKNFLSYKILNEKNIYPNDIMNEIGVSQYEFKKILGTQNNFTKSFLVRFYDELLEADELFKTTSVDEKVILETLVIKYCNG
ncbi:DNA polymerase III subunit delta [Peptoniphilus sp. MSJ-1]|uniref:DNA polymerase III subunit delta n=1 Tax=Peptoniphilus ovalis TaxID=2841503 RepID=A0ABS6FIN9_9FIRM|nr:DNA polymerase III subunit delta [Peptoniphilus ovalis]MBU5669933.1 DNA polymerase III subunit delta [Peptoniphilus ovalis]